MSAVDCGMIEKHIKILRTNAEHLGRILPTDKWEVVPRMSVKRNSKRKQSDSQHKVDSLHKYYSDRIERKEKRRMQRLARMRTMTR